jgi:hypothetical protein
MYIVEAGLKLEPRVPVPHHPREQVPCTHPPPAQTRASNEIGLRLGMWFLATVASKADVTDMTVQGSDTLPLGEDRIRKGSSHPPCQFQISGYHCDNPHTGRYITVGVTGWMIFLWTPPCYNNWRSGWDFS